ncbi:nitroreductase family protein [Lutispora sp.]|uniref:nitroreductase family protein n=1 Tax=Lutispora sp. TaxID=2828727 RepID=UPI000EDC8469|nr:nitroreductase family protein [Lutispora sp.]MEA4963719.1 nitroreductase family protein [Lutispora sp.]HCJ58413.1 hypothetical protein [Clostridiaceae bacterium]
MNDNIFDIISKRATCRSFIEKEIPEEIMDKLLDAACKSPSSGGFQTYSIIKVTEKEKKKQLVQLSRNQRFIEKAPVNLVFCIDFRRVKRIIEVEPSPCIETDTFMNFWMGIIDAAISAQTLCLAAEAYGLKTVYIGNIINTVDEVAKLLNIPQYVCPVIMVTIGYPTSIPKTSLKYDKSILVHEEEYKDIDIDVLMEAYKKKDGNQKIKAAEKLVEKIYNTAKAYHGEEYAEKCKQYILEKGIVSTYQYWFGCYYLEEEGFLSMQGYKEFMKGQGFKWL